ncbi:InlB B-repeat-containing protein [Desulfonatronum sp. SC1]|uniref:InlB B-repeat-containing protein n=1 Tax=Desulfonatronum sp. SC1 TaxID=2109626 RepID=UPI000D3007C6|nr:InlB B-repeat-containing protein [Desulfonatronum sp. SC1]PTN33032.1 hypothetical protein C6366_15435 [Desulfonatronum sp. SC1]
MRQVLLAILLSLSFLLSAAPSMAQTATPPAPGGEGTERFPYEIATLENLYWIAAPESVVPTPSLAWRMNAHYIQTADIDAAPTQGWVDGGGIGGWTPIGATVPFVGHYDGQGHTISNLFIHRPGADNQGLFGSTAGIRYASGIGITDYYAGHGRIENLGLIDVDITGRDYVGGLIGLNVGSYGADVVNNYTTGRVHGRNIVGGLIGKNDGLVMQCHSSAHVTGDNALGGLVGDNDRGSIINSYATGAVSGGAAIGGLVARNAYNLTNVYATGAVSGTSMVGGLVGLSEAATPEGTVLENAYATGAVTEGTNVGGLIGLVHHPHKTRINNTFYDQSTTGQSDTGKGTPKTTAQLNQISTFNDTGTDGLATSWLIVDGWWEEHNSEFLRWGDWWVEEPSKFVRTRWTGGRVLLGHEGWWVGQTSNVWGICEGVNNGYPFLLWQFEESPCSGDLPAVSTQAVQDSVADGGRAHGSIDGLGKSAIASHGFCWATSQESTLPTLENTCHDLGPAGGAVSFSAQMTGLYPDTPYHVRAFARNKAGVQYGPAVSFTTASGYTVSYHANGATSGTAPANQTSSPGQDLTLATNSGDLARHGFSFAGWNTQPDGTGVQYAAGATYTAQTSITLYAEWTFTAPTYTVTFDLQGGRSDSNSVTAVAGSPMPAAAPPVRFNHVFGGYFTQPHGRGTQYYTSGMKSIRDWDLNANATFYAYWLNKHTGEPPSAGDGTPENPYQIATLGNLYWIAADDYHVPTPNRDARWSAHYVQTADIDASPTRTDVTLLWREKWIDNFKDGWRPIANFTGVYDGGGHTISELFINRANFWYHKYRSDDIENTFYTPQGMFGTLWNNASIKNLGLIDVDIEAESDIGALAGRIVTDSTDRTEGMITNCYATGKIWANPRYDRSFSKSIGGLVGNIENLYQYPPLVSVNRLMISDSHADVTVSAPDSLFVGGLIGSSYMAFVKNSYATGDVTGFQNVGGLLGHADYSVFLRTHATGSVTGKSRVGGLVGIWESHLLINSYATGHVTGYYRVGGLVGENFRNTRSRVFASYATGNVTGIDDPDDLYSRPILDGLSPSQFTPGVGGLLGYGEGWADSCYATGAVTGQESVGGLHGGFDTGGWQHPTHSYAIGRVIGQADSTGAIHGRHALIPWLDFFPPNNIWSVEDSGTSDTLGFAKSPEDMRKFSTYSNAGWKIVEGWTEGPEITIELLNDFPYLLWRQHYAQMPEGPYWGICPGVNDGLPFLLWQFDENPCLTPGVATRPVQNILSNRAGGRGRIDGLGSSNPTDHGVCWATTENPTVADTCNRLGPITQLGNFTAPMLELEPGTTYHVRAFATNEQGTGYGQNRTFTTAYRVSYDANGATSGTPPEDQPKVQGVDLTLAGNTGNLARTGHTFAGWNTMADGSGTQYDASASYAEDVSLFLYGRWIANQYTVTLDHQGGSSDGNSVTAVYDAAMPAAAIPTRPWHTFHGYFTAPNGGGTQYYTASMASARNWDLTEGATLYAWWTRGASPAEGNGTAENPYRIAGLENLFWIAADAGRWDKHYRQTDDIDATPTFEWENGGWTPIGNSTTPFTGVYDGQGYAIDGLFINRPDSNPDSNNQGLFGVAGASAELRNLGLTHVNITGNERVGGLVGINEGTVKNSLVTGAVAGNSAVGGLVGRNAGTVENSHATATTKGNNRVGGLVGNNLAGVVTNSYAVGNVTRTSGSTQTMIGAFCGLNNGGTIRNSYSTGSVSVQDGEALTASGFVGSTEGSVTCADNFWDSEASNQTSAICATAKLGDAMKNIATYDDTATEGLDAAWPIVLGWNAFNPPAAIWGICLQANGGYPFLLWQFDENPCEDKPIVATRFVRNIGPDWAGGRGRIDNLGVDSPTQHGLCWATSEDPTVDDTCSRQGPVSETGLFFHRMEPLEPGTTYHVRAYATNTAGTGYGQNSSFTTLHEYTISYNPNNATSGTAPDNQTKVEGQNLTLAANTGSLARTGHTFAGWNTQANGSGTDHAAGEVYTTDASLTLYARWIANSHTLSFDSAGGSEISPITQDYGTAVTAPANPTRVGYTFTHWNPTVPATMPAEDLTLVAQWTAITSTVTFDRQGGSGGSAGVTATFDAAMPAATAPTWVGHTFGGYFLDLNDEDTQYYTAAMASARTWDRTEATTLLAKWTTNITQPAGAGTSEEPYLIATLEDLNWITASNDKVPSPDQNERWAAHYRQTANINAAATNGWADGDWTPIGNISIPFSGLYDGDGHTIDALFINRPDDHERGLFGVTQNSLIRNLGLTNVNVTGNQRVGGLVGQNQGSIANSFVTGTVTGSTAVGGLVGRNFSAIADSHATATITGTSRVGGLVGRSSGDITSSYATGTVTANSRAGGLLGNSDGGSVTDSYATGDVTRASDFTGTTFGGFFGQNLGGTITTSFSIGRVLVEDGDALTANGFVGADGNDPTYADNFWDSEASNQVSGIGATGKVTAMMQSIATFTDTATEGLTTAWDFDGIWAMDGVTNSGYPYLRGGTRTDVPLVTTQAVTDVTPTTATGHGNITSLGAPDPSQHGVCWSTTRNPAIGSATCTEGGEATATGAFTAGITGLTSGTTYYVRAYATNDAGTGYGGEVEFVARETFTVTGTTEEGGSISPTTHTADYLEEVSFTVTADAGHSIAEVTGCEGLRLGNIYRTGAITESCTVTATFSANQYTISFLSAGGTLIDSITQTPGTPVTAPADPTRTGYTFAGWHPAVPATMPEENIALVAQWTAITSTVTTGVVTDIGSTTATGNGNMTSLGSFNPTAHGVCWSTTENPTTADTCDDKGAATATGAFTASITGLTPGTTYYVRAFATNAAGTAYGENQQFSTLQTYTVSGTAGTGGNIDPASRTVAHGTVTTFTVTPNAGFRIRAVSGCNGSLAENIYTTGSITSNCTVQAVFDQEYTITPTASPVEGGTVSGGGVHVHGSQAMVRANAATGWVFTHWLAGSVVISLDPMYTFTVTGNLNPVAMFSEAQETYEILVLADPEQGGTVSGGGEYDHDQPVTVHATARNGYIFTRWTEAGIPVSTNAQYTFPAHRDRNLTAHFRKAAGLPGVLMLLLSDE